MVMERSADSLEFEQKVPELDDLIMERSVDSLEQEPVAGAMSRSHDSFDKLL